MRSLTASACLGLLIWHGLSLAASAPGFDWSAVTPSRKLKYQPCYDGFDCARLSVPRNWLDMENNKTVELAIIRLPATVPTDDPSFGGTIITNPGGPGGSGVAFLQSNGRLLQKITEGKKHYEILSFDPRGVDNTTPRVDCFGKDHVLARDAFQLELRGTGGLDASEVSLKRGLALYDGLGALCADSDVDVDILAYISTASVARDIVEIADRIEEHREAGRETAHDYGAQVSLGPKLKKALPRVQYWGFSYGTVLGNTLASMYPGRMGRVILDGVADIHDYMGCRWLLNLLDTEKIVQYFYDTCFEAGVSCPLWRAEDESSEDIKRRIDKLVADADESPVTFVPADHTSSIRVITGSNIRNAFTVPVYKPLPTGFPQLATALAEALKGNYSLISPDVYLGPPIKDACSAESTGDAQEAIACGDARYFDPTAVPAATDFSHWQKHVQKLKNESVTMGATWASISASCSGWRVPPKWGFTGPWTTPPADPSLEDDGAPAAPILFTSARLDPVTPLGNAYRMSDAHPGSAVLQVDGAGHCAVTGGWSECFNAAVRAYLDDGILPENGTVCADTGCKPFVKGGECRPPGEVLGAGVGEDGFVWSARERRPLGLPF